MVRIKKTPTEHPPRPQSVRAFGADSPYAPRAPKPNPPRPNKRFLAIAVFMLAIWMAFLAGLAFMAHKWF